MQVNTTSKMTLITLLFGVIALLIFVAYQIYTTLSPSFTYKTTKIIIPIDPEMKTEVLDSTYLHRDLLKYQY